MFLKSITVFILNVSLFFSVQINTEATTVPITIQEFEKDLTGDGFNELIQLKALPLDKNSDFFRDVWVDIIGLNNSWSVVYGGAYKPKLNLLHLTHDDGYNLLFSSSSIDDQHSNYQLHIFQDNDIKEIDLPKLNFIQGKFEDGFQISVTTSPDGEKEIFTIDSEPYTNNDVYTEKGELIKPISTKNDIPVFKKHYISKQQGYGIKSFQTLRDPIQKDALGTLEILWYFEDDKWIIIQNNGFVQNQA